MGSAQARQKMVLMIDLLTPAMNQLAPIAAAHAPC
jgi:hypothetical protein